MNLRTIILAIEDLDRRILTLLMEVININNLGNDLHPCT
jgi:hypothetical protein